MSYAEETSIQVLSDQIIQKGAQAALDTLPRFGLTIESSKEERIAKIFGLKVSLLGQLLKRVKDTHQPLFKRVMKEVKQLGLRRDMPKEEFDAAIVCRIFAFHDYRKELLIEHFELESAGNKLKSKPPILEYELIKAWNPAYDFTGRSNVESITSFALEKTDKSNALKLTHVVRHINQSMPAVLQRRFRMIADEILLDLANWDEKTEHEKELLAGAAFAVASATSNIQIYLAFACLVPEFTDFIYLEDSIWCKPSSEIGVEPLNARHLKISRKIIQSISQLERFSHSLDLNILNSTRADLDVYEKEVLELSAADIDELKQLVSAVASEMDVVMGLLKVAGYTLDADPLESRIQHWQELLQLKLMDTPSHARHALVNDIGGEANQVLIKLKALRDDLETIAQQRDKALTDQQPTWTHQLELLQQAAKATEDSQEEFHSLCEAIKQLERIQAQQVKELEDESSELCIESQLENLRKEHAQQLDSLKYQLEQSVQQNNKLRKDCAEAKQQADALKLSMSEQAEQAPVLSEELFGVIDMLALNASPAEILKLLEALYPDRIEILDSAYVSANEHQSSIPTTALYQRVKAFVTDGLDILRKTGRIIDCKDVVPGEISVQESDTVRASAKLRNMRHFTYKGSKRAFYPHFRLNHVCRIYFDYMADEQRIVIAYVGRHLPT